MISRSLLRILQQKMLRERNSMSSLLIFDNSIPFIALFALCDIGDGLHGISEYQDNDEYYFINGNNLSNWKIVFDAKTKIIPRAEYEKIKIQFGKIVLFSINGTIGNITIYNNEKNCAVQIGIVFSMLPNTSYFWNIYIIFSNQFGFWNILRLTKQVQQSKTLVWKHCENIQ